MPIPYGDGEHPPLQNCSQCVRRWGTGAAERRLFVTHPSGPVPWVLGVDRAAIDITPDDVTAPLLARDQPVMVWLAHVLVIVWIDEQRSLRDEECDGSRPSPR